MDADGGRYRSSGPRGMIRAQGLAMLFASVLRTWIDDEDPGHARTMAALDRALARGQRFVGFLDDLCYIPSRICRLRSRRRSPLRRRFRGNRRRVTGLFRRRTGTHEGDRRRGRHRRSVVGAEPASDRIRSVCFRIRADVPVSRTWDQRPTACGARADRARSRRATRRAIPSPPPSLPTSTNTGS